ncbi:MAG TPA: SGNH/GDSL hydrolase family protein, partial [Chitinophagaceae bacterium]|nr:SGNH/GDSL hydrolase family protein [Chitinophagaceae bacterium]
MNRIRTIAVCALIFFVISGMGTLNAQVAARPQRLTEASTLTIVGKVMEGEPVYHRADTNLAIFRNAPPAIKRMLAYSTGLGISFRTNSTAITARWCTSPRQASSNNTGILTEGLDLYIKREEKWIHAGIGRPDTKKNCSSYTLVENMDTGWKECLLYLPVVDELKSLTIGTDADAQIIKGNNPFKHKILIYGSSIAHGSAASRPGMTYPARLSRLTGINFINFGFAGNAKMEKNMAESLSQLNVDAFILDCVPNTNPKLILERTANLVKIIRAKHPGKPIIAIQSVIREGGNFN